jgi:cysteine-rich repeat protein
LAVTPDPCTTPTPAVDNCGNGIVDPGEECDDGNLTDQDGCSAECKSELIPGHGAPSRACFQEWFSPPVVRRDKRGLPSASLHCTDDDPQCDYGDATGDAACTFHVAFCFNVYDRRRTNPHTGAPFCSGAELERVYLTTRYRFANETVPDAIDVANRAALEKSLTGIGAVIRGQCVRDESVARRLCTADADCDTSQGRGDGVCRGRFLAFVPPLTGEVCTDMADVVVPLRAGGVVRGEKWIRLRTMPSDDPTTDARRFGATNLLRLYCDPAR